MNVFKEIKNQHEDFKRKQNISRKVKDYYNVETEMREGQIMSLRREATEYKGLLKDKRYPHFQRFVTEIENYLIDKQRRKSQLNTVDAVALESARISAQLDLLYDLKNRPEMIVRQIENEAHDVNVR